MKHVKKEEEKISQLEKLVLKYNRQMRKHLNDEPLTVHDKTSNRYQLVYLNLKVTAIHVF